MNATITAAIEDIRQEGQQVLAVATELVQLAGQLTKMVEVFRV